MPTSENKQQPHSLWGVIPSGDYQLPLAPVTHSVRKRITAIQRLFRSDTSEQASSFTAKDTLRTLHQRQLDDIAPSPQWNDTVPVIENGFQDWLRQTTPDQPVMTMVGPPRSGRTQILTTWAEHHGWQSITPPSAEQILSGDDTLLSKQIIKGSPWIFPEMERAFVRHPEGLGLIRRFMADAFSGALGRGIIGCNSWAWAYLRHVWRGHVPGTLSFQAFDKTRLMEQFQRLADPTGNRQILFRQSDNGRHVLPPPDTEGATNEISSFLQFLAAHSRGIFGVAWALWRSSLRTEPDETVTEDTQKTDQGIRHQTVWVIPWSQVALPELPSGARQDEAFVLHTLLLHNGLDHMLLPAVLPLSPNQILETLSRLKESGLVIQESSRWQVTALGYPAVRQFLQARGYLVDQF